jgi:hypothetical protein
MTLTTVGTKVGPVTFLGKASNMLKGQWLKTQIGKVKIHWGLKMLSTVGTEVGPATFLGKASNMLRGLK